jgi:hypothetical protein
MSIVRSKLLTWGRGPVRTSRDLTKPDGAGRREGQPSKDYVAPDQVRAVAASIQGLTDPRAGHRYPPTVGYHNLPTSRPLRLPRPINTSVSCAGPGKPGRRLADRTAFKLGPPTLGCPSLSHNQTENFRWRLDAKPAS